MLAVFDLVDPVDLPRLCEPLFHALDALIDVAPALSAEELATALAP